MAKKANYIALKKVPDILVELTGVSRAQITVYVWATKGRISSQGTIVKLKTVKRMGRLYTTHDWVENFVRSVG